MDIGQLFTKDNKILSEQPVFAGTMVPIETLVDHLAAGVSLDDLLADFLSVTNDQAAAILEYFNNTTSRISLPFLFE